MLQARGRQERLSELGLSSSEVGIVFFAFLLLLLFYGDLVTETESYLSPPGFS